MKKQVKKHLTNTGFMDIIYRERMVLAYLLTLFLREAGETMTKYEILSLTIMGLTLLTAIIAIFVKG